MAFGGLSVGSGDSDNAEINMIPLIDVMLVLLVIVLTTATFISTGQIPVNLAKAKEVGDRKDVPIVITLNAEDLDRHHA